LFNSYTGCLEDGQFCIADSKFRVALILVGLSMIIGPQVLLASAIDPMNNASGFFSFTVVQTVSPGHNIVNPAGYLRPSATANGNGTVTLAVKDSHSDTTESILDWTLPGGLSNPYTNLLNNRFLQLNLTGVSSGSNYDVNFLFFGSGPTPTFLSEISWLVDAGPAVLHPNIDVSSLAPSGADQYFVRFRLLPSNVPATAITLDSITTAPASVVPEPASILIVALGASILLLLRGSGPY
jgi:hypothetical protein